MSNCQSRTLFSGLKGLTFFSRLKGPRYSVRLHIIHLQTAKELPKNILPPFRGFHRIKIYRPEIFAWGIPKVILQNWENAE